MKLPLIVLKSSKISDREFTSFKTQALQFWPEAELIIVPSEREAAQGTQFAPLCEWAHTQCEVVVKNASAEQFALAASASQLLTWLFVASIVTESHLQGAYYLSSPSVSGLSLLAQRRAGSEGLHDVGFGDFGGESVGYFSTTEIAQGFVRYLFQSLTIESFHYIANCVEGAEARKWKLGEKLKSIPGRLFLRCYAENEYLALETLSPKPAAHADLDPPLLFVHRGDSEYLRWAIAAARRSNPAASLTVLSDCDYSSAAERVEVVPLSQFWTGAAEFEEHYIHGSPYPRDFELFCFQRWIVLSEYASKVKLKNFMHLDSDVMLVRDNRESREFFQQADFTLSHGNCGHCAYFSSPEPLFEFTQFVVRVFSEQREQITQKVMSDEIFKRLKWKRELQPLNDMLLLELFSGTTSSYSVGDSTSIIKGATFDHSVGYAQDGYEMERGMKKFSWENGAPWCLHRMRGKKVRFNLVHFQGGVRGQMQSFFNEYMQVS